MFISDHKRNRQTNGWTVRGLFGDVRWVQSVFHMCPLAEKPGTYPVASPTTTSITVAAAIEPAVSSATACVGAVPALAADAVSRVVLRVRVLLPSVKNYTWDSSLNESLLYTRDSPTFHSRRAFSIFFYWFRTRQNIWRLDLIAPLTQPITALKQFIRTTMSIIILNKW